MSRPLHLPEAEFEAKVETFQGEQPPEQLKDLLAAVREFDKLSDPLDLTFDGRHLSDSGAAAAIKAGRKLSRIARAFAALRADE